MWEEARRGEAKGMAMFVVHCERNGGRGNGALLSHLQDSTKSTFNYVENGHI
jgi:hypothetical protein